MKKLFILSVLAICFLLAARGTVVAQNGNISVPKNAKPAASAPKPKEKTPTGSLVPRGYVDLVCYWKALNESGFYTYDEAVSRFGSNLPSDSQLQELKDYCTWTWTGSGYKVFGPNGNSIVLPAAGVRLCGGSMSNVGDGGDYWSSTPSVPEWAMALQFHSDGVSLDSDYRCNGFSVRLVQD